MAELKKSCNMCPAAKTAYNRLRLEYKAAVKRQTTGVKPSGFMKGIECAMNVVEQVFSDPDSYIMRR